MRAPLSLAAPLILAIAYAFDPAAAASSQASITPSIAHASEVSIPDSYHRTLKAKANGVTYKLTIFLPKGYDPKSGQRYPVFYIVPGDTFGVTISQFARYLSSGDIPRLIVVGIDFDSDDSYFKDLPTAGPDPHWTVPADRGAANFLRIVEAEIKPFVDAHFPTDPSDTGIGGHSLGGFFALYAMFHDPATFRHVYASSPSFVWQDFVLLREEAALAAKAKDLPVRAFVDQGALEGDDGRLAALTAAIQGRHYPSLLWDSQRTPGQTHQTIAFADGIDALYHIYGPKLRQASTEELSALEGQWTVSDGTHFRLAAEHGRLFALGFRDEDKIELLSAAKDEWFIRYLRYHFSVRPMPDGSLAMEIHPQDTPGPNGTVKASVLQARRTGP